MFFCKMFKILEIFICFGILFDCVLSKGVGDELLSLAVHTARGILSLESKVNPNCRRDFYAYLKGMKNKEIWALEMMDSMEKFPSGVFLGRRTAFGQIDECLDVIHPNFTGQYCLMDVAVKQNSSPATLKDLPNTLQRLQGQFTFGICVPSTCNSTDLENTIGAFGLNEFLETRINEIGCDVKSVTKFRLKDYSMIVLFCVLIFLTAVSTAYEVFHIFIKKTEVERKILTTFSLHSNIKLLFRVNENSKDLNALYGIRFLSFVWVVLGHFYLFHFSLGNEVNVIFKLRFPNDKFNIPFTNAFVCVDTFFFLSGMLACFVFFRSISEKGSYDAPVAFIHRYLRLTPSLAVIVLFNFTLLSHTGITPYSKPIYQKIETTCREYWWTYILYLQNIYYMEAKTCFPPAWYLSSDMQMFLFSPMVLYVLFLWPKFAPKYLCGLILGSSLTAFLMSYKYDLPANRSMEFIRVKQYSTNNEYVWFHTRMTPWLVGVATGYIICGIKSKKISFRPKKVWVVVGWLCSAGLCLSSLYGIAAFYPFETALSHSKLERSSYRAFHRLGWSLGLSWVVIACVNDYGGPINAFLSYNIFQPLAKLSYCAFLIHHTLQLYRTLHDYKNLIYLDSFTLAYTYFGDLVVSILMAIPMSLLIEIPFCHIEKILLQKLRIFPYPRSRKTKILNSTA